MTFSEAAQRYFKKGTPHLGRLLMEQDVSLFQALGESRRFGGMALSDYVNHLDPVSYTHLDVYKRQHCNFDENGKRPFA